MFINQMARIWSILSLVVLMEYVQAKAPMVKIVPATHLKKIEDVTVYENSAKLVFKYPIPSFWRETVSDLTDGLYGDHKFDMKTILSVDVSDELFLHVPRTKTSKGRGKRSKGFVRSMGSIVSTAWKFLYGDDDDVEDYVNKLQGNVVDFQKNIILTQRSVQTYAQDVSKYLANMEKKGDQEWKKVQQNQLLHLQRDWLVGSKNTCLMKKIPPHMVPAQLLAQELYKLNSRLAKINKTLAIPPEELSKYYKSPIVDCMISETQVVIMVNVPIKRIGNDWELYEMVHSKFAFNNQTCSIYPQEANYLASSQTKSVMITNNILRHCDVHEHGLCLVPEYTKDSSESLSCAVGILQQKPVSELRNYCAFRCSPNTELMVQQLDESTLAITNAVNMTTTCPTGQFNHTFTKQGLVLATMQCHCTMLIDGYYFIDSPIYCYEEPHKEENVFQGSPNLWSRLDSAIGHYYQVFSKHTNITFDEGWNMHVPVLNITPYKEKLIPTPDWSQSITGISWLEMQMHFLTLVVAFLFVLECLRIVKFFWP